MIVRLTLPKRRAGSTQSRIGISRGRALNPPHHLRQRAIRRHHQVDMVWHDDPGTPLIKPEFALAVINCRRYNLRNTRIAKPKRARNRPIHQTIALREQPTRILIMLIRNRQMWPRPIQTPRDEQDRCGRIAVRKVALLIHGGPIEAQKAYATSGSLFAEYFSRQ